MPRQPHKRCEDKRRFILPGGERQSRQAGKECAGRISGPEARDAGLGKGCLGGHSESVSRRKKWLVAACVCSQTSLRRSPWTRVVFVRVLLHFQNDYVTNNPTSTYVSACKDQTSLAGSIVLIYVLRVHCVVLRFLLGRQWVGIIIPQLCAY